MIIVIIMIAAILCIAFPAQILTSIFLGILHFIRLFTTHKTEAELVEVKREDHSGENADGCTYSYSLYYPVMKYTIKGKTYIEEVRDSLSSIHDMGLKTKIRVSRLNPNKCYYSNCIEHIKQTVAMLSM